MNLKENANAQARYTKPPAKQIESWSKFNINKSDSKIEKDEKMALIFFQTAGDSLRITKVIDWSQNANPFKRRPESHNIGCMCNLELMRVLKSAGSIVDRLIANVFLTLSNAISSQTQELKSRRRAANWRSIAE